MKNIKFITITILLLTTKLLVAQNFEVPENIQLKTESDYAKYQMDVVKAINWLEETKINEQTNKREDANAFVLKWIMGTPTFSIALQSFQFDLTQKNPELLSSFLGGWARFAIENPSEKDDSVKANMEGFKSIMKVYSANKTDGMKKDKKIEKLLKLEEDQLQKWIEKKLV